LLLGSEIKTATTTSNSNLHECDLTVPFRCISEFEASNRLIKIHILGALGSFRINRSAATSRPLSAAGYTAPPRCRITVADNLSTTCWGIKPCPVLRQRRDRLQHCCGGDAHPLYCFPAPLGSHFQNSIMPASRDPKKRNT
jgi:hypothetical protein